MIVSIRGASGAGKTTLARALHASPQLRPPVPQFVCGRRKPLYYIQARDDLAGTPLVSIGHYEIVNGGMDTIDDLDAAYEVIEERARAGCDVLYEGKTMTDGVARMVALRRAGHDVRVLHLATPVAECIRSVRARGHTIAEDSIRKMHERVFRLVRDAEAMGVRVYRGNREACLMEAKEWLAL